MRSFLALDVPDDLARHIASAQSRLGVGRMVPRENLHVTLAFLDDQPESVLEELDRDLGALSQDRFPLDVTGYAHFGKSRPRIAYLGVASSAPLLSLHQAVRRAARAAGIALSHERYIPHITIARFSGSDVGDALPAVQALARLPIQCAPFDVFGFTLYGSTLTPTGPRYEPLASYPMR